VAAGLDGGVGRDPAGDDVGGDAPGTGGPAGPAPASTASAARLTVLLSSSLRRSSVARTCRATAALPVRSSWPSSSTAASRNAGSGLSNASRSRRGTVQFGLRATTIRPCTSQAHLPGRCCGRSTRIRSCT
jgi:hypothetical protein